MMPKLIMSIAMAFLLGVTLAGCAQQLADFRAQLVKQTADIKHKPSDVWRETAERGGE